MKKATDRLDAALGLHEKITRRDFLNGVTLSAATMWAAELSPMELFAQTSARPRWSGNTEDAFAVGHAVRDGAYNAPNLKAQETGEVFDLVIVGGGFSGLGAAYYFRQTKQGKVLLLENHQTVGGNARRDEFNVKGRALYAPQASIVCQDLPPAFAPVPAVERTFQELGVDFEKIRLPKETLAFSVLWDKPEPRWYANIFEAPISDAAKQQFMAFIGQVMPFYQKPDWREELRRLDQFTFRDYAGREQKWTELYQVMQPDLAAFFSLPDQVSAAAVFAQYGGGPRALYSFPGGNSGFLRYLLKGLIPGAIPGQDIINAPINAAALDQRNHPVRIRTGATVVRVEHEGRPDEAKHVRVTYARGGKLFSLRARGVVMAGGGFITQHIVRDLPPKKREAYRLFKYAPILQINVALNNSRALCKAGVNYISTYHDGFGVVLYNYEKMSAAGWDAKCDPERPGVVSLGVPLLYPGLAPQEQAVRGRTEMLATSFQTYERKTREELTRLLGPWGFDSKKDIAAIAISRWGHHGYAFPYPGIYSDGAAETARKPHGRIAFAHTDLERFSHMIGALTQAHRAVQDLSSLY